MRDFIKLFFNFYVGLLILASPVLCQASVALRASEVSEATQFIKWLSATTDDSLKTLWVKSSLENRACVNYRHCPRVELKTEVGIASFNRGFSTLSNEELRNKECHKISSEGVDLLDPNRLEKLKAYGASFFMNKMYHATKTSAGDEAILSEVIRSENLFALVYVSPYTQHVLGYELIEFNENKISKYSKCF